MVSETTNQQPANISQSIECEPSPWHRFEEVRESSALAALKATWNAWDLEGTDVENLAGVLFGKLGFSTSRLVYRRVSISTQKETARRLKRKLHKVETSLISSKRLQVSRNTTAVQGYGMLWRCSCLIVSTRLLGCSAQLPPFIEVNWSPRKLMELLGLR